MKEIALLLIFIDFMLITFSYLNVFYDLNMVQWITNMGDWVQRLKPMMQQLMAGDYGIFINYPPIFFFLMIPFYQIDFLYLAVLTSAIVFGAVMLFTYRMEGFYAALMIGIMLISNFIFLLYSLSIVPTLLEVIFFLIASYFFLKDRKITASLFILLMNYTHVLNILFFTIFLIYSLIYKRGFLKYLAIIALLSLPALFLYTDRAIIGGMDLVTNVIVYSGDYVIKLLLGNPLAFIASTGLIMWLLLPVSLRFLIKHKCWHREQLFYVIWLLVFLLPFALALVTYYDVIRWIFLFIIPLSVFEVSILRGNNNEK